MLQSPSSCQAPQLPGLRVILVGRVRRNRRKSALTSLSVPLASCFLLSPLLVRQRGLVAQGCSVLPAFGILFAAIRSGSRASLLMCLRSPALPRRKRYKTARGASGPLPIELMTLPDLPLLTSTRGILTPALRVPKQTYFEGIPPREVTPAQLAAGPPDAGVELLRLVERLGDVSSLDVLTASLLFVALGLGFVDLGPPHRRWASIFGEEVAWLLGGVQRPARRVEGGLRETCAARASWPALRRLTAYLEQARPTDVGRGIAAAERLCAEDTRLGGLGADLLSAVSIAAARAEATWANTATAKEVKNRGPTGTCALRVLAAATALQTDVGAASLESRERLAAAFEKASPPRSDDGDWAPENDFPRYWSNAATELRLVLGLTFEAIVPAEDRSNGTVVGLSILAFISIVFARLLAVGVGSSEDAAAYAFFAASWAVLIEFLLKTRQESRADLFGAPEENALRARQLQSFIRWADSGALRRGPGAGTTTREAMATAARAAVPDLRIASNQSAEAVAVSDGELEELLRVWHPELKKRVLARGLSSPDEPPQVVVVYENLSIVSDVATIWR